MIKPLEDNLIMCDVNDMKRIYSYFYHTYDIWDIIDKLEGINDESDPDNDLPQIVHAYQTAESIRTRYIDNNRFNTFKIKSLFSKNEWEKLPQKYKLEYSTKQKN